MKLISRVTVFSILLFSFNLHAETIQLLNDRGFETSSSKATKNLSWPTSDIGTWGVGDPFTITGSKNGINPLSGSQMMELQPPAVSDSSHDIYQVVDVTDYTGVISAGNVVATASAMFNATDSTWMGLTLFAWSGAAEPTAFGGYIGGTYLERIWYSDNNGQQNVDSDLTTWELFEFNVVLPANTTYLLFGVHEATNQPTTGGSYDYVNNSIGYADYTSLTITFNSVPEPATLALMGFGLIGLGFTRRKRIK